MDAVELTGIDLGKTIELNSEVNVVQHEQNREAHRRVEKGNETAV